MLALCLHSLKKGGILTMKENILNRYGRTRDKKVIIDIAAEKIGDLYNNLDKYAPYRKKELDPNLVAYLIESAREIGKKDFVIQLHISASADPGLTSQVKTSIHNFFLYLVDLELRTLSHMARSSLILFAIGVVILSLSVWINQQYAGQESVLADVFAEGLNVAAWVSLWYAIANLLINWAPHRQEIHMYRRIATAPVFFHKTRPDQQQRQKPAITP